MMVQPNLTVRTWRGSPYRTFEEFFSKNCIEVQKFVIDPLRRTIIIGKRGTRFTFFPFSFVDYAGNPVNEEVEIRLTEVFTKLEMILTDKVTTSEDRLLESGGQFHIEAFQGDQPVHLVVPVSVDLPVRCKLKNALAMHLFKGSLSKTRGYQSNRLFDWTQISNKPLPIRKIGTKKFFHFEIADFNWWNCDFYCSKRGTKTMVSARHVCHLDGFDDMTAYLVFENSNSVTKMYRGEHSFTSFNIPSKQPAFIVMMAMQDGQLYFGKKYIPKLSNKVIYVSLEEMNELEMLDALTEL